VRLATEALGRDLAGDRVGTAGQREDAVRVLATDAADRASREQVARRVEPDQEDIGPIDRRGRIVGLEIGRASCRERV